MRTRSSLPNAFRYAFAGLYHLIRTQRNARIHLGFTVLVIVLGAWLNLAPLSWAVLLLTMGLVWSAEAINSALESLVDIASPEWQPPAQAAKDLAAAAVLIAALVSVAVGFLLLGPPLLDRLGFG